jgi:hypothetical protein
MLKSFKEDGLARAMGLKSISNLEYIKATIQLQKFL